MFNDSINNNFTLSFDSWTTNRRMIVNTGLQYQVDIGSFERHHFTEIINSSSSNRSSRSGASNKASNIAIFHNLDVRKYFVENDGIRYPRD